MTSADASAHWERADHHFARDAAFARIAGLIHSIRRSAACLGSAAIAGATWHLGCQSSQRSSIEANNGETLGQLAAAWVGITRVGAFSVAEEIATGQLVPLLEEFNPGDVEAIHAVFVGGTNTPARVRVFVDFLAERLGKPAV